MNGAYLAVQLGPIQFQPAEFAKLGIVIFLASYLRDTRQLLVQGARRFLGLTLPPLKHFGPLLVVWGLAMLMLLVIRDLGSSVMFFGAFLALLYVATNRLSFPLIGLVLFAIGAWYFGTHIGHIHARIEAWQDPFNPHLYDQVGGSYQIAQSLFAQADGGMFGTGFGQSLLGLPGGGAILPAAHTDLIYAVITNELGLVGASAVLLTYLLICERGFKIALLARDSFSKLLATGLTVRVRAAGLRDRRRSDEGDPADRRHASLHLLRRLVDPGQLRAARAAAARLRPRPEAGVNQPDHPPLRPRGRALRRAHRLHVAVGRVRLQVAQRQRPEQARRARGGEDRPRGDPGRRRHGARPQRQAAGRRVPTHLPDGRAVLARRRATPSPTSARPASSGSTTTR